MKDKISGFLNRDIKLKDALCIGGFSLLLTIVLVTAALWYIYSPALKRSADYSKVIEAFSVIEDRYIDELDHGKMTDYAIEGLIDGLDTWSNYISLDELEDFQTAMNNSFVGIGVNVMSADDGLVIDSVIPSSPAEEAGLEAGFHITAADGVSFAGMTSTEASSYIKGKENTTVILTVTDNSGTVRDISVVRRSIVTDPVTSEMIGSVGYIALEDFCLGAGDSCCEKIDALIESGAKGLVFDVRFNGGGLVDEMTKILDHLLGEGEIFVCVNKAGDRENRVSDAACISKDIPVAVLVNNASYSAAEYFAAVLQEYGRAVVVGQHTTGKGHAQTQTKLSDGSILAISTLAYCTPLGGIDLSGTGITPDVEFELSDEDYSLLYYDSLAHENDGQLSLAISAVTK